MYWILTNTPLYAGCKYVSQSLANGRHGNQMDYVVMPLLGDNLGNLRRKAADHRFSLRTTMQLGMQMLRAIKEVHDAGYLHRDIKPVRLVSLVRFRHNLTCPLVGQFCFGPR